MEIDVFGDTAVVHARYSQVASWEQNNLSNVFRLTDVWARGMQGWQVVARHSSILG
jgi:ketosteroid isomerase-like protein